MSGFLNSLQYSVVGSPALAAPGPAKEKKKKGVYCSDEVRLGGKLFADNSGNAIQRL